MKQQEKYLEYYITEKLKENNFFKRFKNFDELYNNIDNLENFLSIIYTYKTLKNILIQNNYYILDEKTIKNTYKEIEELLSYRIEDIISEATRNTLKDMQIEYFRNSKDFDEEQKREILKCLKHDIDDILCFITPDFNWKQIKIIGAALQHRVDVSDFADPAFSWQQMNIIKNAKIKHLDISSLLNPLFSLEQMEEIIYGLQNHINVNEYAKIEFSPEQMEQIRIGQIQKLNVSEFADPKLTWREMKRKRLNQLRQKDMDFELEI